jgi:predicted Rossmann fold flavoprotein
MFMSQIIIIGAGASGLMLASLLPSGSYTILEGSSRVAQKVRISGGGKCNVTNAKMHADYFLADPLFVKPALKALSNEQLVTRLERAGVSLEMRKNNQYFCAQSAMQLVNYFKEETLQEAIKLNHKVTQIERTVEGFKVETTQGSFKTPIVVVASGGLSYAHIGASDVGYRIAQTFGHRVVTLAPSLVGLTVQKEQFFFKALSGNSVAVEITVEGHLCKGDLLFTHKGMSGPAVLDASLYWKKGAIEVNFLPNFDFTTLQQGKKLLSTRLPLSKSVVKAFLEVLSIEDRPVNQLTHKEIERLKRLQCYKMSPAGTFGYKKAEVTRGGVDTTQIDAKRMESKKVSNLYFIGEVLDVTGRLGGYNLQWAFSSATVCAGAIKQKLKGMV